MKILIACDMEGITGVTRWEHCTSGESEYERFRRRMTEDVNAVAAGAFAGGADEVWVADGHNRGQNLLIENLDSRIIHSNGTFSPWSMMNGIDQNIDAVMFVGYHAKAGTANAILAHTWSKSVLDVKINGQSFGETALNAMVAGSFGAPVILVSGDQQLAAEATAMLPTVECAIVKQATGYYSGFCLPPEKTDMLLRDKAEDAVRAFEEKHPEPFKVELPIHLEITFNMPNLAESAARFPGSERTEGRTVAIDCASVEICYQTFRCLCSLAAG